MIKYKCILCGCGESTDGKTCSSCGYSPDYESLDYMTQLCRCEPGLCLPPYKLYEERIHPDNYTYPAADVQLSALPQPSALENIAYHLNNFLQNFFELGNTYGNMFIGASFHFLALVLIMMIPVRAEMFCGLPFILISLIKKDEYTALRTAGIIFTAAALIKFMIL